MCGSGYPTGPTFFGRIFLTLNIFKAYMRVEFQYMANNGIKATEFATNKNT